MAFKVETTECFMLTNYVTVMSQIYSYTLVFKMSEDTRKSIRYSNRQKERNAKRQKVVDNLLPFDEAFSFEQLNKAFYKCKKGVAWKESIQKYEAKLFANNLALSKEVLTGKYKQRPFIEFDIMERGKLRHIRSVYIRDRIVQKALCDNILVPLLSHGLIYDNGASLKGKGTLFSINRVEKLLRKNYKEYGDDGYVILGDFHSYFDTLDHDLIYDALSRKIPDSRVLNLIKSMIDPFGEVGLGLGSQVSQILAVNYLNDFDHIINCKYGKKYVRYMDDFIIFCDSKKEAQEMLSIVKDEVEKAHLQLNENKTCICKITHRFTFLKTDFKITKTGKVIKMLTRQNVTKERRKLKKLAKMLEDGVITFEEVKTSYQSWRGYAKKKDAYYSIKEMDRLFDELFIDNWHGPIE